VITVVATGPLATVQDEGRPGWASVGVSRSGAADRASAALANRLVGNAAGAAAVECTFGGLALRFEHAALVAVTGAPCAGCAVDAPCHVPAGHVLRLGVPSVGLRTYVAVRGGLAVGDDVAGAPPGVDVAPARRRWDARVALLPGPRLDWFAADALDVLCTGTYTVMPDSNRTALRLDGPALRRVVGRELPSEGLVPGAVQVPPDGRPVVFLVDHPVTGGYPVVAVARERDLDVLAQRRPGDAVRFTRAG
jgi:allophanate hydrolase subunit 2